LEINKKQPLDHKQSHTTHCSKEKERLGIHESDLQQALETHDSSRPLMREEKDAVALKAISLAAEGSVPSLSTQSMDEWKDPGCSWDAVSDFDTPVVFVNPLKHDLELHLNELPSCDSYNGTPISVLVNDKQMIENDMHWIKVRWFLRLLPLLHTFHQAVTQWPAVKVVESISLDSEKAVTMRDYFHGNVRQCYILHIHIIHRFLCVAIL
jgi:hypothetical protein